MEHLFITMPVFNTGINTFLTVVNWGILTEDGKLKFNTKDGEQIKGLNEFDNCFKIIKESDFDIKRSLRNWRKDNPRHAEKEFVLDNSIDTGEVYRGNYWHLSVQIQPQETQVKVKLLLN